MRNVGQTHPGGGIEITTNTIEPSQRNAAKIAGFAFLFAITIVVIANYAVNFRLIVPNDAVNTASNILANETLFRINIACNLIYVVNVIVLLSALHVMLKPVSRNLALVATLCRLVLAFMWCVFALNALGALRLLGDAAYLPVFSVEQLQTLARLHLTANFDAYYVGLPFWGLASTVCSYLLFKSRYVPRSLAVFGVISSGWCVICAFAFIAIPDFDAVVNLWLFDVPMVLFEIALGLWLLLKGLRPAGVANQANAVAAVG